MPAPPRKPKPGDLLERIKRDPALKRLVMERARELPESARAELLNLMNEYERIQVRERRQARYLDFVKYMSPNFIEGRHIRVMANAFERIAAGTLKRLMINMPPGTSKSENTSIYFPSWYIGKNPSHRIIQCGHTFDIATDFGAKVKDKVNSREYQDVFPGVQIRTDKKAAGHWKTLQGGEYFAIGTGGKIAGRRAHLCVHPKSEVISRRGAICAGDVRPGDELLGRDACGHVRFGRVSAKMNVHSDSEVLVNGKLRCTPEHPIWTENRGWVKALSLYPEDVLASIATRCSLLTTKRETVKSVDVVPSTSNGEYVNFTVDGHNTFFDDSVLTHNCVIDDPTSEQEYIASLTDPTTYDNIYNWFISGPLTRLMPDAAICLVATRWSKSDPCGQILKMDSKEEWEVIEFPALLYPDGCYGQDDKATTLWPEFWPLDKMVAKKEEITQKPFGVHLWNANYQQRPTSEETSIIKREWWNRWDEKDPPRCEYVIQSWDTAYSAKESGDPSACTTWGVFRPDPNNKELRHIIALNSFQLRLDFPELKERAKAEYLYWRPDCALIEAKASGASLIQELRRIGIPVQEYNPSRRDGDKFTRLHSVAELFSSRMVWAPRLPWAEELMSALADFPNGDLGDHLIDTTSQALLRFREGNFIRLESDQTWKKQDARVVREYY